MNKKKMAITISFVVIGMFAFSFAAFPLYNLFCKITGYGGTPKIAEENSQKIGNKDFTILFNSDIDPKLQWEFLPVQRKISAKSGKNMLAFYTAENISDKSLKGMAVYNIAPEKAARYFNKVACFCFDEQTLSPYEKVQMPVSFFIDPKIEEDPNLQDVETITLSYTFFEAKS